MTLPSPCEAQELARLAAALARLSSRLSLEPPDGVLLEIRGSLRLFGGVAALRREAAAACASCGWHPQLAVAATPLAALWLSRATHADALLPEALAGRLAAVPLAACRWPPATVQGLHQMGIDRVGECLRLPREGLARRIGPALLESLDRALGRQADPRPEWQASPRFCRRLELAAETLNWRELLAALSPGLEELAAFLQARQAGVRRLDLWLEHPGLAATRHRVEGVRPARDACHWELLLEEHLQRLALPAPVTALVLRGGPVEPLAPQALALEARSTPAPTGRGPGVVRSSDVLQLVERLQARLGREAVHALRLLPAHRPEAAWRAVAVGLADKSARPGPAAQRRPLWLLPQPRPLACEQGWPCHHGQLVLEQGPERIESGWWDGNDVARDYYVARSQQGAWLWIYRRRRPPHDWFLHGFFG